MFKLYARRRIFIHATDEPITKKLEVGTSRSTKGRCGREFAGHTLVDHRRCWPRVLAHRTEESRWCIRTDHRWSHWRTQVPHRPPYRVPSLTRTHARAPARL